MASSGKSKVEDISWSKPMNLRDVIAKCTFPQIVKVVEGYESPDENETIKRGQYLRIHHLHTQTRVVGMDKEKKKYLSIPIRFADAKFQVYDDNNDAMPLSNPMYIREITNKRDLPIEVKFESNADLTFDLRPMPKKADQAKFNRIVLQNMYEVRYLQGNQIIKNNLDTLVVNIPIHAPVQVAVAEGFQTGTLEKWEKYQNLLTKLVMKNVTFQLSPGNPHITFITDKRMERARTNEHYDQIHPAGTLFITNKRHDRSLASRGDPGTSNTIGHAPPHGRPAPYQSSSLNSRPRSGTGSSNTSDGGGGGILKKPKSNGSTGSNSGSFDGSPQYNLQDSTTESYEVHDYHPLPNIPPIDYDRGLNGGPWSETDSSGGSIGSRNGPPKPPPVSSIPSSSSSSRPAASPPAPPPPPPGGPAPPPAPPPPSNSAPAPPPPPPPPPSGGGPPPPPPPPVGGPPPPPPPNFSSSGPPPPPAPPSKPSTPSSGGGGGISADLLSANRLRPASERALPQTPPKSTQSSGPDMMDELRKKLNRRLSQPDSSGGQGVAFHNRPHEIQKEQEADLERKFQTLSTKPQVTPPPTKAKPSSNGRVGGPSVSAPPPPIKPSSSGGSFKSLQEVPKNLKGLSIADVCKCLELLNMQNCISTFKANNIDGEMLQDIVTKEMMTDDLSMKPLQASQLEKFKNGWRPK